MANDRNAPSCRLCHAPLGERDNGRQLCVICDEYAQHVALESNQRLEKIVPSLSQGHLFAAASRRAH